LGLENAKFSPVKIAVIDSGLLANSLDLTNNIDFNLSYDFTNNRKISSSDLDFSGGHGSEVASIIASEFSNNLSGTGLSSRNNLKIVFLKTDYSSAQIIEAINYAKDNGIKIINASWGCSNNIVSPNACSLDGDYSDTALKVAIESFPGVFCDGGWQW